MKKLFIVAIAMMAAVTANAQFEPGTLSIQPRIGGTGSMFTNAPKLTFSGMRSDVDATAIGGAIIGADFEYQMSDAASFSIGANWAMAGSGWKDFNYNGVDIKDLKVETSYINIPVLLNYYLFRGFAVKAGIQPGFLTSAKYKATAEAKEGGVTAKVEYDEDCKNMFKKFDLSIPVGVSYEFPVPIVLDLRFNFGLFKVNKETYEGYKDSRNMSAAFTVGYKFAL